MHCGETAGWIKIKLGTEIGLDSSHTVLDGDPAPLPKGAQPPIFGPCLSSFFFFLAYSQRSEIGCLSYFYTWCGLSANLECRSEMCCMRLAGNTGRKNRHLCTITQLCQATCSQLRYVPTIGKKLVKQQYVLLKISPPYGEHRPIDG